LSFSHLKVATTLARTLADDIGVEGLETFAEQHEIDPLVQGTRRVAEVRLLAAGVTWIPGVGGALALAVPFA
jgi:hypothetical protein